MRVSSTPDNGAPPREPNVSFAHEPLEGLRRTNASYGAAWQQAGVDHELAQDDHAASSGWTHCGVTPDGETLEMIQMQIASLALGSNAASQGNYLDDFIELVSGTSEATPIVTGLGTDVDAIINQSPSLVAELNDLIDQDYTIEVGPAGGGTYIYRDDKRIVIEEGQSPEAAALSLAHEVGHAINQPAGYPEDNYTREEFIELNTRESLRNEALATLYALDVRAEILAAGGPDIGSAGAQSAQYIALYDGLPAGPGKVYDAARLALVEDIADLFAFGETPSTNPSLTYDEYYRQGWAAVYDA